MVTIGITGGIGSGKSIVSHVLAAMGYPVYIADEESRRLTATHPAIKSGLVNLFGEKIFENGVLKKAELAKQIFGNKELLMKVNAIIHPVVMQHFEAWRENQQASIVFIETAILFEAQFHQFVDKKLVITAPVELRIKRVQERDHLSESEIRSRMANQLSDEEKIKLSDYVIVNDGRQAVLPQIQTVLEDVKQSLRE